MIKVPSSMQLQQMQEIEEENLSEAETDSNADEVTDAQFRIHNIRAVALLRELRPAVQDLLSWVGVEARPGKERAAMLQIEKRIKDLLAAFELEKG